MQIHPDLPRILGIGVLELQFGRSDSQHGEDVGNAEDHACEGVSWQRPLPGKRLGHGVAHARV
jgi:hypothetical protein